MQTEMDQDVMSTTPAPLSFPPPSLCFLHTQGVDEAYDSALAQMSEAEETLAEYLKEVRAQVREGGSKQSGMHFFPGGGGGPPGGGN
jgi:hypothetical protein